MIKIGSNKIRTRRKTWRTSPPRRYSLSVTKYKEYVKLCDYVGN